MGLWARLTGRETRAQQVHSSDPYLAEFLTGRGLGGVPSPFLAENLATVLSAVNAISSAVGALPAYVYRTAGQGREIDDAHPLQRLIALGPNPHQTWNEFVEWIVASALLRGNGLAEAAIDGNGAVSALRPFPWSNVAPLVTQSGALVFDVTDGTTLGGPQRKRRLLEAECLLLKDRSDDGLLGRSRLSRAGQVINAALQGQEFAGSIYAKGAFPSGAVQLEGKLGDDQRKLLRAQVESMFAGSPNAGRILLLDQNLKWQQISISPEDAELLASRRFGSEELARIFNTPPAIVGDLSHGTFTNSETAGRWFAQFTLRPWISKLQSALAKACFTSAELTTHSIEFDLSDLLRGDPEVRWKSHQIAVASKVLTPNEIRSVEGWNPREGGDDFDAPQPTDLGAAIEWLRKAIILHEGHMDGSEPTSEASQKKMMDQMMRAYALLTDAAPLAASVSATADAADGTGMA